MPHPSVISATGALTVSYVKVYEAQNSGVEGGGAVPGWQTRVLNTEIDTDGVVTLSSNQLTFTTGTYDSLIFVPHYQTNGTTARLRNVTDGTTVLLGLDTYATGGVGMYVPIVGRFTVAASKALEVQMATQDTTRPTTGLGKANGFTSTQEIYTVAEFWKVA